MKYKPFAVKLQHDGNVYEGKVVPFNDHPVQKTYPRQYMVTLNGKFRGVFTHTNHSWESTSLYDEGLVSAIGKCIIDWYQ
jgi:hypothetical protein